VRYRLEIDEQITEVEWTARPEPLGALARVGEDEHQVRGRAVSAQELRLEVDGRAVRAFWAPAPEGRHVFVEGRVFLVKDADQAPRGKSRKAGAQTPGQVSPPMPAVVVRILVAEGDLVKAGQGLVVVSAMKMEAVLAAPHGGLVKRINTTLEAKVAPGDILVEIEEGEGDQ
jgi:3-methylcrotonyl-CoA carboxylase alpha subunit